MAVGVRSLVAAETDHTFVTRTPDFFTEENWFLSEQNTLVKLPLPIDAEFRGVLGQHPIVRLRTDWSPNGEEEGAESFAAGSLISMNLAASVSAGVATELATILDPGDSEEVDAIADVSMSSEAVYITALKDVAGVLLRAQAGADGWELSRVALPGAGAIQVRSADDYSDTVLVSYQSFLVPSTLYLVQDNNQPRAIKALQPRFDASKFVSEQKFASSADGTRIPYFVVRPNAIVMDGTTPTELTAYGGFELSRTPSYMGAMDQAWLTRGGAYVLANIRGGGAYGPSWHQSAILENRYRVYEDFIAVAEDLLDSGLTSSEHLGIRGGSNGGLLVTAVMVQRPELFKGIISSVPLIDMLRYHKLLAGGSWMAEYGNPHIPEQRAYISEYSPYQLVSAEEDYPEIFLWTNPKDDRVHPGHARKMAARMIEQGHDIIYFENAEGGHGGGANLQQLAQTNAMQLVYLLQQLAY
jgi:prolyl oligopeptidase